MKCAIIAGGTSPDVNFLRSAVSDCDFVICADLGLEYASLASITADVAVGDFDSGAKRGNYKRLVTLPTEKDDTDTMSAARIAVDNRATEAVLLCCTGTRFDHTYANLFVLDYLRENGVDACITDEHNKIFLLKNSTKRIAKQAGYLSVLPFCSVAEGVSISGVKYPLKNANLTSDFPIGVSNEIVEPFACVTVNSGTVAIVLSSD